MKSDKRLIVALDTDDFDQVRKVVAELGDDVSHYKVGMQLYYSVGAPVLRFLRESGKDIFLDLKLHDIPNTVAHSLKALTGLGASILDVHAGGGLTMMRAAAQAVAEAAEALNIPKPKLIAITVLTSIDAGDWEGLGNTVAMSEQVVRLAKLAKTAGLDGVVASPQEAALIRQACGRDFLVVTPGVRPRGSASNDQSRTATPAGALAAGASHLVVGRPILAAPDRRAAAAAILREMEES